MIRIVLMEPNHITRRLRRAAAPRIGSGSLRSLLRALHQRNIDHLLSLVVREWFPDLLDYEIVLTEVAAVLPDFQHLCVRDRYFYHPTFH